MASDRIERLGLSLALTALVVTGGASSAARLVWIAAPLLVFQLPLKVTCGVILLGLGPTLFEYLLYDQLIGSLGGRISIVCGAVVGCSAVALGQRLLDSRDLREHLARVLPYFCAALLAQALLRLSGFVPEAFQYLSGNHLSALILWAMVPVFALRMAPSTRWVCLALLSMALVATGSRWGIWVGVVFSLVMIGLYLREAMRSAVCLALLGVLCVPIAFWDGIQMGKAGLLRALASITDLRPWTGLGPGGAETVSLQYVEQAFRLTHIETLLLDWAATFGWVWTVGVLMFLLGLIFVAPMTAPQASAQRVKMYAAVGLAGILCHDLFDFSLFSGSVRTAACVLVGILMPYKLVRSRQALPFVVTALMATVSLVAWHHYDPMRMELSDRLEEVPERLGTRSFRYWLNRARRQPNSNDRLPDLARALQVAPGCRDCWFELGDVFWKLDRFGQALQAYQSGLAVARPVLVNASVRKIAALPNRFLVRAVGDHLGAARTAAVLRLHPSRDDLRVLLQLDRRLSDPKLRQAIYKSIERADLRPAVRSQALWELAARPVLLPDEGQQLMGLLTAVLGAEGAEARLIELVERNPGHCEAIAWWRRRDKANLVPLVARYRARCARVLIGKGVPLGVLREVELAIDP